MDSVPAKKVPSPRHLNCQDARLHFPSHTLPASGISSHSRSDPCLLAIPWSSDHKHEDEEEEECRARNSEMDSTDLRGGRVSVKKSIHYICELIAALGVPSLTPETLRLAKFNQLPSQQCLLRALHDIVTMATNSSPTLATSREDSLDDEILGFVKFHLALWGYPPHSPLFTLHVDGHGRSRHLLLALGWMISHCELIERGLERRLQELMVARSAAPLPDEYPLDMATSVEALDRARKAESGTRDYVRRMIAVADRAEDEGLRTEMRAEQVMMLYGQVRTCLNAIEALQQTKVKKLHELHLAQLAAGVKHPHTPYELHLLQHRNKLDLHSQAIAAAKAIEDEKEACRTHEDLFWQWMESAAHEELAQSSPSTMIDLTGVTEAELLPAIEHLKQTLATCDPSMQNDTSLPCRNDPPLARDSDVSTLSESFKRCVSIQDSEESMPLPQDAKEIAELLLRPPVFVYRPKEKPESRPIKTTLRKDEENDPHTALFKMKRLMEVDEMVRGILARTRAENRAAIMEIMKPIIEDENFVVVGL